MNKEQFKCISAINYWSQGPQRVGFIRETYIKQLVDYLDNNLLKVLIGQRRSGKSYILKQMIARLLTEKKVPAKNILYLNFELHELNFIQTDRVLADVVSAYYNHFSPEGKVYLFFDEIQEVEYWEKLINSYLADERYEVEIFLTGSNAHLLSTELSTFVTGRYVEIPVFPFSFSEYAAFYQFEINRANLISYLESSGIPELFSLKEDYQKRSYLAALQDSILMNDIVKRFNIKNVKLLKLLLDFIIDNISHLFSLNSIVRKLKSCGASLNVVTVGNYLNYLERTFLIHSVARYDVKGKKILEGERKYYINDLGFSNYLQSTFDNGVNRKLENYVYQVLSQAGYHVSVGNIYNLEIDFVAEKDQKIIYLQVTYLLHSEKVIQREYGNLEKIKDHWPKWVVSLDELTFPAKNGIEHIPAWKLEALLQ